MFFFVVVGSFTADSNLLQPSGSDGAHEDEWRTFASCKQFTSHVTFFSCTDNDVSHDIGSSVCARHLIHVSYA